MCQQHNEQLAIEDAKEKDKLLIEAEEAYRGNGAIVFKDKKIIKALPATPLAKMVAGKNTPLNRLESSGSQASGSHASASQANATLRQQAKEQLAIEDAKEECWTD